MVKVAPRAQTSSRKVYRVTLKCVFCGDILPENEFKRCVDLSLHGNVSGITHERCGYTFMFRSF